MWTVKLAKPFATEKPCAILRYENPHAIDV